MENKGGNYFEFISDFAISIWDMTIVLFHRTSETLGTFGTISAPKTPKMTLKRRLLDGF
nr:hypothetical protein [Mucilaginibacter sp. E4BP6]